MRNLIIAAAAALLLAACAAPQPVADRGGGRLECLQVAQAEVPGRQGAYGGFHEDDHPYYLPRETPLSGEREPTTFVDPYFRAGEAIDPHAYRGCLLGERPPG